MSKPKVGYVPFFTIAKEHEHFYPILAKDIDDLCWPSWFYEQKYFQW